MRVPRISVPLAPRIPFLPRHSDPDASGHRRRPGDAPGKARRLRRQRRLTQRLRQLSPFSVIRKVVFSRPIWRIGRAPVAPGVSSASADDVVLELTSGGSSSRHALLAPDRTMEVALRDDMPAPALRRRVWSLSTPAIGEQLLALGVGVSDTFLSGHLAAQAIARLGYDRATAVAAVGAASTAVWVILTIFFAVNIGVTALVARATGARDARLSARAAGQGILLGAIAGLAMMALAVPLAGLMIHLLGVT
ncbi:MAG TPA: MATE family efflux transporter, partial [Ktedonobacterales bacterium]